MLWVALLGACGGDGGGVVDGGIADDAAVMVDAGPPSPGELLERARPACGEPPASASDVYCAVVVGGERVDGASYGIAPDCPLRGEHNMEWAWNCNGGVAGCHLFRCSVFDDMCSTSDVTCELRETP